MKEKSLLRYTNYILKTITETSKFKYFSKVSFVIFIASASVNIECLNVSSGYVFPLSHAQQLSVDVFLCHRMRFRHKDITRKVIMIYLEQLAEPYCLGGGGIFIPHHHSISCHPETT